MDTPLQRIEILLIEDNLHDAELTIRTLKKNNVGNKLFHVADGAEALDFLFAEGAYAGRRKKALPHIILLDLNLPKLSGTEVLRRIKNDERTHNIPVIVLTTSSEAKDILESYQIGVNGYIIKPVTFSDFAKTVSDIGFYWLMVNKLPK